MYHILFVHIVYVHWYVETSSAELVLCEGNPPATIHKGQQQGV